MSGILFSGYFIHWTLFVFLSKYPFVLISLFVFQSPIITSLPFLITMSAIPAIFNKPSSDVQEIKYSGNTPLVSLSLCTPLNAGIPSSKPNFFIYFPVMLYNIDSLSEWMSVPRIQELFLFSSHSCKICF